MGLIKMVSRVLPLVEGVYFRLATGERLSNQGDVVITSKSREQDYQWILKCIECCEVVSDVVGKL